MKGYKKIMGYYIMLNAHTACLSWVSGCLIRISKELIDFTRFEHHLLRACKITATGKAYMLLKCNSMNTFEDIQQLELNVLVTGLEHSLL